MSILVIGEKGIKGATCMTWEEVVTEIPTLGDHEYVFINMETLKPEQLARFSTNAFSSKMMEAINAHTRIYCLTAPAVIANGKLNYSIFPFKITAVKESGKAFKEKIDNDYFRKVKSWNFYLRYVVDYENWKFIPFFFTRHGYPLAIQVESNHVNVYGFVFLYPPQDLAEGESSFKNLFNYVFSDNSKDPKLPDFIEKIPLAKEDQLAAQITSDNTAIKTLTENIKQNTKKIEEINSKKGILAFTGKPLERSVKKVCKELGLTIGGVDVYEEDGTLELDGNSIPVEIKGHNGGITMEDVRQVIERVNKAKVKDGIPVKGILFANPYAETPLDKRGADFHYNIIEAAKPWGICLIGTHVLFEYLNEFQTYDKTLLPEKILKTVGVLEFQSINSEEKSE
jgi:hypothetical protein